MSSFNTNEPTTHGTKRGGPKKKSNIKYKRLKKNIQMMKIKIKKERLVNEAYDRHNSLKF